MAHVINFAKWLAHSVFEVKPDGAYDLEEERVDVIDLQCGKTVFNDVPARVSG
jgi:hypothetical protein